MQNSSDIDTVGQYVQYVCMPVYLLMYNPSTHTGDTEQLGGGVLGDTEEGERLTGEGMAVKKGKGGQGKEWKGISVKKGTGRHKKEGEGVEVKKGKGGLGKGGIGWQRRRGRADTGSSGRELK